MFNEVGRSPLVSGFFWDDFMPDGSSWPDVRWPDARPNVTEDTGLTKQQMDDGAAAYWANMAALENHTLSLGKFAWQMLWTGGDPAGAAARARALW